MQARQGETTSETYMGIGWQAADRRKTEGNAHPMAHLLIRFQDLGIFARFAGHNGKPQQHGGCGG